MSDTQHDKNHDDHNDPQPGPEVSITVNGHSIPIHRGSQTVAHIKQLGGVAAAEELEQVIDGKLTPLADDGHVTIKGHEVFISHVRASAGS